MDRPDKNFDYQALVNDAVIRLENVFREVMTKRVRTQQFVLTQDPNPEDALAGNSYTYPIDLSEFSAINATDNHTSNVDLRLQQRNVDGIWCDIALGGTAGRRGLSIRGPTAFGLCRFNVAAAGFSLTVTVTARAY